MIYKLFESKSLKLLEDLINEYSMQGWQLQNIVAKDSDYIIAVMVKGVRAKQLL